MPRPDEGLIHAWLDGELEGDEATRVEKLVAEDAEWAAAAAEARGLIAASSRILGALDVVPGDVIPRGGSAAPAVEDERPRVRSAVRRVMPTWIRMAAVFALVAGVGYLGRTREVEVASAPTGATEPAEAVTDAAPAAVANAPSPAAVAPRASARAVPAPPPPPATPVEPEKSVAQEVAVPPTAQGLVSGVTSERMRGVAGGVAAPVSERILDSPNAVSLAPARMALKSAAVADAAPGLEGCWRIVRDDGRVPLPADSVQRALRFLGMRVDTLVLAIAPEGTARVVRIGADTLRGAASAGNAPPVRITAVRIICPAPE